MVAAMSLSLTTHQIGLIFMLAGVVSIVANEPLARLDFAFGGHSDGPFSIVQSRMRTSRTIIVVAGVALLALAALVIFG
jgi:hypothetical protein